MGVALGVALGVAGGGLKAAVSCVMSLDCAGRALRQPEKPPPPAAVSACCRAEAVRALPFPP